MSHSAWEIQIILWIEKSWCVCVCVRSWVCVIHNNDVLWTWKSFYYLYSSSVRQTRIHNVEWGGQMIFRVCMNRKCWSVFLHHIVTVNMTFKDLRKINTPVAWFKRNISYIKNIILKNRSLVNLLKQTHTHTHPHKRLLYHMKMINDFCSALIHL